MEDRVHHSAESFKLSDAIGLVENESDVLQRGVRNSLIIVGNQFIDQVFFLQLKTSAYKLMFHDCFHSRSIVETLFILRLFLFFGFSVFNQ